MSFELKAQTYDWRHLLKLPFDCEPLCTLGVVAQKLMTGVVNVVWVLVEAEFLNLAIACAMSRANIQDMYPYLAAMLFIILWKRMGYSLGRLLTRRIEISSAYQMNSEAVKKRSRLHYSLIEDEETWELSRRVSKDMEENIWGMLQQTCNFLVAVVRIFGVFLIIFTESIWLGIVMMIVSAPLLYFSVVSGKRSYKAYKESSVFARKSEYLKDVLTGRDCTEERSLFAYSGYVNQQWNKHMDEYQKISMKAEYAKEMRRAGSNIVTNVVSTGVVFFLILELTRGAVSIGIFIALSKAIYDMINLMNNEVGRSVVIMAKYTSYMKDLTVFANLREMEGTNDLPAEQAEEFESLLLKDVSFRYPGTDRYIIKGMNMKLVKGHHYAFVGENGAGKTTLTKLFTGLYDEYEGSILLNGRELKEYHPSKIKAMFSNVWQDFARYQDTAANNILIGDVRHMEDASSRERMEKYAKELAIWQELHNLRQGFDTPLGRLYEQGADLSGGQWQRVAMARSLMNPAPVQILDEPTAALDPVSESRLYEEFERISKGRTTIFISHRLGSIVLADQIFVLRDGKVEEAGSHVSLMKHGGLYQRMYESQRSWYKEEQEDGFEGGVQA